MRRFAPATTLLAIALAISPTGCVQDNIPSEEQTSSAASTSRAIQWPALRALDELAHRTPHIVEGGDPEALKAFAGQIRELAIRVAEEPVPSGASDPGQVRILQADLKSLAGAVVIGEDVQGGALTQTLEAFGPIVHRLMASVGLPHEHAAHSDHDHGEHDHGEQDHGEQDHDHDDHDHASSGSVPKTLKDLQEIEGPGPNGGTVLHASPTTLLELVVDPEKATIRLYALDDDEQPYQLDDPLSAEMIFEGWDHSGKRLNIALYPDSSTVTYGHFDAFDEGLRASEWIVGRLKGKFRESGMMTSVEVETGWPPTHPDAAERLIKHDHSHEHQH